MAESGAIEIVDVADDTLPKARCRAARSLVYVSLLVMWLTSGIASAQAQGVVTEQGISISLTVFAISIITTAGATWTVAKWDSSRMKKMEDLEAKIEALIDQRDRRLRKGN